MTLKLSFPFLFMAGVLAGLSGPAVAASGDGLPGPVKAHEPLMRVVDIRKGESARVRLSNGKTARVELLDHSEVRDPVRGAVRLARVRLKVNGKAATLECGSYRLPVSVAGVQVDCAITKEFLKNTRSDPWGLEKDARLRLWPADSPLMPPGAYVYPVKQRWFATDTQMANEPSYVDGSETPSEQEVYYHYGLDIGGAEGLTEVVSATDGLIVVRGKSALAEYRESPYTELSYDGVIVLDERGWYHWYFHLASIDSGVQLGRPVRKGQPIGLIGKEGSAGCWSHLHYEIRAPQPSGKAGIVEGYAFLWEAYHWAIAPEVIAVARPHSLAWVGETVVLDGNRSWSSAGRVSRFEWSFSDGTTAKGPVVKRTYPHPGTYSEILKVTDHRGHSAYDFAVVQIVGRQSGEQNLPPTIHASYWPTIDVRAGQRVTFLVRTCRTTFGHEIWNFGDGSPPVEVTSDGCSDEKSPAGYARTEHVFSKPGDYLVRVERANERGEKAIANLFVPVR